MKVGKYVLRWQGWLGELGCKRAVEPLIAALQDENKDVQICTLESLVKLADERATGPIIDALRNENIVHRVLSKFDKKEVAYELSLDDLVDVSKPT